MAVSKADLTAASWVVQKAEEWARQSAAHLVEKKVVLWAVRWAALKAGL